CFFFFSSRRRHTRFSRDWSSDVCSSDLWGGRSLVPVSRRGTPPRSTAHPWIEAVYLFGSRARGNVRPSSDIDLAVLPGTAGSPKIGRASCRETVCTANGGAVVTLSEPTA